MIALLLLACGTSTPEDVSTPAEAAGWGAMKRTQSGKYEVTLQTLPDPPVMGEFFVMQATVALDGKPVERAAVILDARMPQHNHGMETEPKADPGNCASPDDKKCEHPGGIYRSNGFKFHMHGDWTVLVDVDGPVGRDSTTFLYEMK